MGKSPRLLCGTCAASNCLNNPQPSGAFLSAARWKSKSIKFAYDSAKAKRLPAY
jgi:hypothetical protein